MIINNYDIQIDSLVIHWVGNKNNDDGIILSKSEYELTEEISTILLKYFISPIRYDELYEFTHNSDIELNEVYNYVFKIFENPKTIQEQSVLLANYLYENSKHPKIKSGEFYVAHFSNIELDNRTIDAVGVFKSEKKDTFLDVYSDSVSFFIENKKGININKLDKGCLIFNTKKERIYRCRSG